MSGISLRGVKNITPEMRLDSCMSRRIVTDEGCWLWTGKIRRDGYGVVYVNYKDRLIHSFVYDLVVGGRSAGTNLHHLCEHKHCFNPEHLSLLTTADHAREHGTILLAAAASAAKRRHATHCQRNHEFSVANTYWTKQGWRRCRACNRRRK